MFHPHHVPADLDLAIYTEILKSRAHWGYLLFSGSPARRLAHLFTLGVEYGNADGGERDPEYPARYFQPLARSCFW